MNKAIGVVDSGVGGLTIAKELMRQLPKENIIYLGDTARCPYGSRSQEEVLSFTWDMARFLLQHDIKALVIACNTATAFALESLKKHLHIPVIGVIKAGSRAAITATKTGKIGVIGTEGTIRSKTYNKVLQSISPTTQVRPLACPLFASMVERGMVQGEEAHQIVASTLEPLLDQSDMDTLILGCTHYPLLADVIQNVVGPSVKLISSSDETAREISTVLDMKNLLNTANEKPYYTIYTTGDLASFKDLLFKIFPDLKNTSTSITIEQVQIV